MEPFKMFLGVTVMLMLFRSSLSLPQTDAESKNNTEADPEPVAKLENEHNVDVASESEYDDVLEYESYCDMSYEELYDEMDEDIDVTYFGLSKKQVGDEVFDIIKEIIPIFIRIIRAMKVA